MPLCVKYIINMYSGIRLLDNTTLITWHIFHTFILMGRHHFQTAKIIIVFEPAKVSFKTWNCINYVSGSKAADILDPFAPSSLGRKFIL